MGECGCNDIQPHEILKVGENVLVVEIYRGCSYCDTGIMVGLHLMPPDDAEAFGWEPTGKLELDNGKYAMWNYPIVGPDDLLEAAKKMKADEQFGGEGYDTLTDWLMDNGLEFLQKALAHRLAESAKEKKRGA